MTKEIPPNPDNDERRMEQDGALRNQEQSELDRRSQERMREGGVDAERDIEAGMEEMEDRVVAENGSSVESPADEATILEMEQEADLANKRHWEKDPYFKRPEIEGEEGK